MFKRQWKMAATTTLAAVAFALSPCLWMGTAEYRRAMDCWWLHASRGLSSADPTQGVLGEEKVQNISLRPALARYLMRVPESHESYLHDPLRAELLDLPPATAGRVIKIGMLLLAAGVAWGFRARVERRDDPAILWECAAISVALLLYSPITWGQHCVGVLPAIYLVVRTRLAHGKSSWPVLGSVAAFTFVTVVLSRDIVGSRWSLLLYDYHIHTACLLGLLLAAVSSREALRRVTHPPRTVQAPSALARAA